MAIRTVAWKVAQDLSVTPMKIQNAGVQGDNNVTRVEFSLPSSLCSGYTLYFEYVDAAGGYDKTEPLNVSNSKVGCLIPLSWTQLGGNATVRLVATKINGDTDDETAYTLEGRVSYYSRSNIVGRVDNLIRGCLQAVLDAARKATSDANTAATYANSAGSAAEAMAAKLEQSADLADEAIEKAEDALKRCAGVKGVYVGSGEMPPEYNVQIDPTGETDVVSVACGGTGATNAETARKNLGAVPLGLGLGEIAWYEKDIDDITKTGVYSFTTSNTSPNKPCTMGTIVHLEQGGSANIATQVAIDGNYGYPVIYKRKRLSGSWGIWFNEIIKLSPDKEYLTTEMYSGKPVYVKRVSYNLTTKVGATDGVSNIEIPHGISGLTTVVRCDGRLPSVNYSLPYISNGGGITTINAVTDSVIKLRLSNMQWEPQTFEIDVYYTK